MSNHFHILEEKALTVLHDATCDAGILALPIKGEEVENYTRIWSRDSIMAGMIGLDYNDAILVEGLRKSLDTLKNHQSKHGIIPSNVSLSKNPKVSYGGTAGRVDATLWYIIGALSYYAHTSDDDFRRNHIWHLEKAMEVATIWEFNHKHLIYTPLSGNWADEYPIHGYTLYDNCLRLWGLELYATHIDNSHSLKHKIENVRTAITNNFLLNETPKEALYHEVLYTKALSQGSLSYFVAGFNPSRYFRMFDAGGNGLALMLNLLPDKQLTKFSTYLEGVFTEINLDLMPAFWPVIQEGDEMYHDLESNHAYSFKNVPHHFHNGGIWPIMNGWLAKGLKRYGQSQTIVKMAESYVKFAQKDNYTFSEYISSDTLENGGKAPLSYSATGVLMMLKLLDTK